MRHLAMEQTEFLQPDAHGDWRDEELLGQRTGDAIQHIVVGLGALVIPDQALDARDLNGGVVDWGCVAAGHAACDPGTSRPMRP
jgi:hypothetical protein